MLDLQCAQQNARLWKTARSQQQSVMASWLSSSGRISISAAGLCALPLTQRLNAAWQSHTLLASSSLPVHDGTLRAMLNCRTDEHAKAGEIRNSSVSSPCPRLFKLCVRSSLMVPVLHHKVS